MSGNDEGDGPDLRDTLVWSRWAKAQNEEVRQLLSLCGYEYIEQADTISLVFANTALRCITESSCEHIVEAIKAYYDRRRSAWLEVVLKDAQAQGVPRAPRHVVMPHVAIEIAPPFVNSH